MHRQIPDTVTNPLLPLDPPTFSMLHRKKLAKELLLHFDWIGLILYSGSLAVFIIGMNWGGVLYVTTLPLYS